MTSPCVGDWVDFQSLDSSDLVTGFVVDAMDDGQQLFKVRVPRTNMTYTVRGHDMTPSPSGLRFGDTQALIDLSLETGDEKWFQELIHWEPTIPARVQSKFLWVFIPLASLLVLLV